MSRLFAILLAWVQQLHAMRPAISQVDEIAEQQLTQLLSSRKECKQDMDIAFLLDGSWSVRPEDWDSLKNFMSKTVQQFQLGTEKLQVGIVQYTDTARIEMEFKSTAAEVATGISGLQQIGGYTSAHA
ncbi:unnamed protein product, partial [Effrenium voratum]